MSLEETTSAPAPAAEAPAPAAAPAPPPPAKVEVTVEAPRQETPGEIEDRENAALEADLRKAYRNATRERDETGKFATKDGRPPKTHNQPPEEVEAEQPAEAAQEPPKAPAAPRPRSWAPDTDKIWETLTPEAKEVVHKREADIAKFAERLGQQAKQFEPLRTVLEQNRQTFERNGTDYVNGISALISAQNQLDQNPVNGIANLAQIYGVDLRAVVAQMYGQDTAGFAPDPEVLQLRNELAQMKRENEYRQQQETARQRALAEQQAAQQRQSFTQAIDDFAKDKADFDTVAPEILANIQALQQSTPGLSFRDVLQQAYDRAIWANPQTRQARMQAEDARRLQEAAKAAETAKRAASVNVRSAPKPSAETGEDMDADLRAAYRRAQSRG